MNNRRSLRIFASLLILIAMLSFFGKDKIVKAQEPTNEYYSILDDYYLLNKHQGAMGLCWDFAATRSLETLYAKHLNEYISFSEAGFAFSATEIGVGGTGRSHYYALSNTEDDFYPELKEGFVFFENQLPYELLYYVNGKTRIEGAGNAKRVHDYIAPLKIKGLEKVIDLVDVRNEQKKVKTIKDHIINHSAVYYEIKNYKYSKNNLNSKDTTELKNSPGSSLEQHAISLIGYDDDYKYEFNGENNKGAFIGLNSNQYHQNGDSILYVPYKYVENQSFLFEISGYKWKLGSGQNINSKLVTSKRGNVEHVDNKLVFKNSTKKNYVPETRKFKNNNIFTKNQRIDITYTIPNDGNSPNIGIFDGAREITDKFNITKQGREITVVQSELNSLPAKSYNVCIEYRKNGKKEIEYRQLHILDFAEFLTVNSSNNDFNMTAYQHVDSEKPITVLNKEATKGELVLQPTLYSEIKTYNFDNKGEKPFTLNNGKATIAIPFDVQEEKIVYKTIVFTMNDGTKVDRCLRLIWRKAGSKMTFGAVFGKQDYINGRGVIAHPDIITPISSDPSSEYSKINLNIFERDKYNLEKVKLKGKAQNQEVIAAGDPIFKKIENATELGKFFYSETNEATKKMQEQERKQYQYSFFVEPQWEKIKAFEELDITIEGKAEYIAEQGINKDDYRVVVNNDNGAVVTIEDVEEKTANYSMTNLTFKVLYMGKHYKVFKSINVSKKQVSFDETHIKRALRYNGELQSFINNNDKYHFSNAEQSDIGEYVITVTHKNENYTFAEGDSLSVNCVITEPEVTDIVVNHKNNYQSEDKLEISKIEVRINGSNVEIDSNIEVDYKNNIGQLMATTTSVDLIFYFYKHKIVHRLDVSVARKKIAKPTYTNKFPYTGKAIRPAADNKYWTVTSPESVEAGEYECTFKIVDKENFVFENGSEELNEKYIIEKAKIQYEILKNRVNFKNTQNVEYFDESSKEWKRYSVGDVLYGQIRFRVANNKNYEEVTIELKEEKPADKRKSNTKMNQGLIAGVSIAVISLVAVGVALIILFLKKKTKNK